MTPKETLLDYMDDDGDTISIYYDPEGDPREDIIIYTKDSGSNCAVRIPLDVLREALK